ncbi:MAG: CPBP family intramembrane glutamic endopeptidase [Myxococcota bacterium]|nr:CPBP family intramembrane glutamic endopeptidase [Myxococcota bacterium]
MNARPPVTSDEFRDHNEYPMARRMVLLLLLALLIVKTIATLPWIGPLAVTAVAALQLYWPILRAEKLGYPYEWLGIKKSEIPQDIKIVAILCLVTFPLYGLGVHWYMTEAYDWFSIPEVAAWLPHKTFAPMENPKWFDLWKGALWLGEISLIHILGVALPEEMFYRGYLQPQMEKRFSKPGTLFGVPFGRGTIMTAALFALGHFVGEWNPLRLAPFFPSLIFAWQRNRNNSIFGAILYHGLCNIYGEILFSLYV